MSELFFSDEICYTDIILDLINNYKENILTNESICDTELEELLNPHNDIIAICNISYQNENIRHKLLRMYLNIKRPNSANKDYSKIKNEVRERLGHFFYEETESKPMIITVMQEV